jgi:HD domain
MPYKVFVYGARKAFAPDGLALGTVLPFDVFVNEGNVFTKVYAAGHPYGPDERAELLRRGAGDVYVDAKDSTQLERYLERTAPEKPADPEDPETVREYVDHKTRYFPIDRASLIAGSSVGFGIYGMRDLRLVPLVDATDGRPGTVSGDVLAATGDLVIRNEDIPRYQRYLDDLVAGPPGVADPPGRREKIRAMVIKERSKTVVKELLDDPRSGESIRKGRKVVSELTDAILSNRDVLFDLISLSSYDMYTYTHSVNVAVLSAGIGVARGMDRDTLEMLGIGALLHDVGKSAIPTEILNKPGRLSEDEFEVVKRHVEEGGRLLETNETLHADSRNVVLQHHERLSGTGYPNRLAGSEISIFGRICAIADCYDAMTTNRPYSRASTPFQALKVLNAQIEHYDHELVATFIRLLGRIHAPEATADRVAMPLPLG